ANDTQRVIVESKDDITAGDGAKHDVLMGKAECSTLTTCNTFLLLQAGNIPVAFYEQVGQTMFTAPNCKMFPYEVVVRRYAYGSYLKRNPRTNKMTRFGHPLVETYLKTTGKVWKDHQLEVDDPLMQYDYCTSTPKLKLYHPGKEFQEESPFLTLEAKDVFTHDNEFKLIQQMSLRAIDIFKILEVAWEKHGLTFVDCKFEFGMSPAGHLLLADVVDADSGRLLDTASGEHLDKQLYRDGGELAKVIENYRRLATISEAFKAMVK
ncbi:hypothetical protein H0W32_01755, partial [Patescibacteria group bacterium]|nr:hypothetical protein [Patescibacteria group bacterium]